MRSQKGLSIIGLVIAAALFILIAMVLSRYIRNAYSGSTTIADRSECQAFLAGAINTIHSHDNALKVRSYLPTSSAAGLIVPADADDPFCDGSTERQGLCDTQPLFALGAGNMVNPSSSFLSQNIRGATTWALNVFNNFNSGSPYTESANLTGAVCAGNGMFFEGANLAALQKLFPEEMEIPRWVLAIRFKIQQMTAGAPVACSATDAAAHLVGGGDAGVGFMVSLEFAFRSQLNQLPDATPVPGATPIVDKCAGEVLLNYTADGVPPIAIVVDTPADPGVRNGLGKRIPQAPQVPVQADYMCTCREPWNPGACDEMYTVQVKVSASEPGAIFLCKRELPASEADVNYIYCGDLPGGNMTLIDSSNNPQTFTYNEPTRARFSFANLTEGLHYRMNVAVMDVGGNISPPTVVQFWVKKPSCPPTDTYCPNSGPPDDGCGGLCDPGTMPPSCPPINSYCGGPMQDICGNNCGIGTGCPPPPCSPQCPDPSTHCSDCIKDGCGNTCAAGTMPTPPAGTCVSECVTPPLDPCAVPPAALTVVDDQAKCCGQGVYYCKEYTAKWIKDWAYDLFCCAPGGVLGPREDLDDVNGSLYACWASNRPRPRCRQVNKYVCLGPGSEGRFIAAPNCRNMQVRCGYGGAWHDDMDGGSSPGPGGCAGVP